MVEARASELEDGVSEVFTVDALRKVAQDMRHHAFKPYRIESQEIADELNRQRQRAGIPSDLRVGDDVDWLLWSEA